MELLFFFLAAAMQGMEKIFESTSKIYSTSLKSAQNNKQAQGIFFGAPGNYIK